MKPITATEIIELIKEKRKRDKAMSERMQKENQVMFIDLIYANLVKNRIIPPMEVDKP